MPVVLEVTGDPVNAHSFESEVIYCGTIRVLSRGVYRPGSHRDVAQGLIRTYFSLFPMSCLRLGWHGEQKDTPISHHQFHPHRKLGPDAHGLYHQHHCHILLRAGNKQHIAGRGTARHARTLLRSSSSIPCAPYALEISTRSSCMHPDASRHSAPSPRRERPAARSSHRRGCANYRLLVERKLPADPHGTTLGWRERMGRARQGAAETALGPVNVPDAPRVVDFVCRSEHVLCVLGSGGAEVWR
ncbi:hypothetical protein EDB85DRAFT_1922635 [Lactarius pseudohatsudake]|nr:hypothetical protein EDB85DRAFT_1922635 [Lactarius pseudohatsudake]